MMALRHTDLYTVEYPGTTKRPLKYREDLPMQTNSTDNLEEFKAIFRTPKEDAPGSNGGKGSNVLTERLLAARQELEQLTIEYNRLLEVAKGQAERLAVIQPLPGLFLARIEDVVRLVEQRKDGYHHTSEPVTTPDGLDRRFNQAIAQLRLIFEQEHILENQELHEELTKMQSALAAKREEALNLQVENESLSQRLDATLEAVQRFNVEAAAHEERIIRLQQFMKESEAKHHKLFIERRRVRERKIDSNAFTFFVSDRINAAIKSTQWTLPLTMLVIGLVLGITLTVAGGIWGWGYYIQPRNFARDAVYAVPSLPVIASAAIANNMVITGNAVGSETEKPEQSEHDILQQQNFELDMVSIPGGTFVMGTDNRHAPDIERPARAISIPSFLISRYEITFAQYDAFAKATGRPLPDDQGWGRGLRPVINVKWDEAVAYTKWLSMQTGKAYRLPTDTEWEYAVSDGLRGRFWWGNNFVQKQEICSNCGTDWDGKSTAPVGSAAANVRGIYDMGGNVMEWVEDCLNNVEYTNSTFDGKCDVRIVRGGAYNKPYDSMRNTAKRGFSARDRFSTVGFRVVREWSSKS